MCLWFTVDAQQHIVVSLHVGHGFLPFLSSRLLFLVVGTELSAQTHIHTHLYTLHHHIYRLSVSHDCLLQTIRAKCDLLQHLTLSLCNPSSLPLLIYTCFSLHSLHPLFLPCPALFLTVDFFVCTLLFANLFSYCFFPLPSFFFVPCVSLTYIVAFVSLLFSFLFSLFYLWFSF